MRPHPLATQPTFSKADMLTFLAPKLKHSTIPSFFSFCRSDWEHSASQILSQIHSRFSLKAPLMVRSSAWGEDKAGHSNAGHYESIANLTCHHPMKMAQSITQVFNQYEPRLQNDQVIVQSQMQNCLYWGVLFTHTLRQHAPYYQIEYDSSHSGTQTSSITSGRKPQGAFYISKTTLDKMPSSPPLPQWTQNLLRAAKEIENLFPSTRLDIEWAIGPSHQVLLFQVRPLAAQASCSSLPPLDEKTHASRLLQASARCKTLMEAKDPSLYGSSTLYSQMSDWNPGELIGKHPRPLSYSLYRKLITQKNWSLSRAQLGYHKVPPCELMTCFLGRPYIDIRRSLNSLLPAHLNSQIGQTLVEFGLNKLRENPHLHDKIEFEVAFANHLFEGSQKSKELTQLKLTAGEQKHVRHCLKTMTHQMLKQIQGSRPLFSPCFQNTSSPLTRTHLAVDFLTKKALLHFSKCARFAFIVTDMIHQLEQIGLFPSSKKQDFYLSLQSVSKTFNHDAYQVKTGQLSFGSFKKKYGHLRQGSYDILSPRYDSPHESYLSIAIKNAKKIESTTFHLPPSLRRPIDNLLKPLGICSERFFSLARKAIEDREQVKFEFSQTLSQLLEDLMRVGAIWGLNREEVSWLEIDSILKPSPALLSLSQQGKIAYGQHTLFQTPEIILTPQDFFVFEPQKSQANFITHKTIHGKVILHPKPHQPLEGKIVALESADPGWDWIFSCGIGGLVTELGGMNSHMAIRSAELGIPACLGLGEDKFNFITQFESILLDCKEQRITPSLVT